MPNDINGYFQSIMAHPTKDKIFYAEVSKGYIIKIIVDTLSAGTLQRGYFLIDSEGIKSRQSDQGNTILYDVNLPRKNLKNYTCPAKPLVISINLKHLQGLLKNVKKKDSITLSIEKGRTGTLFITIRQDRETNRVETNSIAYQEEKDYVFSNLPKGGYQYPMVIGAPDFQKIKRLTSMAKTITITMQANNYLSFRADTEVIFGSELAFGERTDAADTTADRPEVMEKAPLEDSDDWPEDVDPDIEEYTWLTDGEDSDDEKGKPAAAPAPGDFKAQYYSSIINKLVKLPGLCTQMQFYGPTISRYPLMIEVNAGQGGYTLGTIQVYIKDTTQINYEASIANDSDRVIISKKLKK